MAQGGTWKTWGAIWEGYRLNIGRSFQGEVSRGPSGEWLAALNGKTLAGYRDRTGAMEWVEQEIATLMRLAMGDFAEFRPPRPG